MSRFSWRICLWSIFLSVSVNAATFPNPETRGVWISGSYLQGGSNSIENVIRNLSQANFNTIYVDVWYRGSTIYPSQVVQDAGGPLQNPSFSGSDPLETTIQIAHRYGMEVFAWFEYGFMVGNSGDSTAVPAILKVHPDWAMVQRDTTKHFLHTSYGYYFAVDPSVSAASDFIVNMYNECARNYPDLDGIETDIENDTSVSYSDTSRIRFMRETGDPDPLTLPADNQAWLSWRRLQITDVVKRIYQAVKAVNPQCVVSSAVPPPYMSNYMLESWDIWAKSGYLDMAEPMLYLNTGDFDNQMSLCSDYIPQGFQLSPGIDMSSAGSVSNTIYEIQDAVRRGVSGVTIWYYGYLSTYANAFAELKSSVFPTKTAPSYDDLVMDNFAAGTFRSTGSWMTQRGGYGGNYVLARAVYGDTAIFSVRILRSGSYSLYGYWSGDSSSNCADAIVQTGTLHILRSDTVDQTKDLNTWSYIDKFQLNSGDTVTVKLFGASGGNLIADAFRLRRGSPFVLSDYAVPDSQTILMKFSDPLLSPISPITRISTQTGGQILNAFVDPSDNTILHVMVAPMRQGIPLMLNVIDLLDASFDTLSMSQTLSYDPDSTMFTIDDQTPGLFWKLTGIWTEDTSMSAVDGSYWFAKQGPQAVRAQWGPFQITTDGYYDVYARIPAVNIPLSGRCLYVVKDHFGMDSVYISQAAEAGKWADLGNFPLRDGDSFAVLLSSVVGSDTGQYLVADAVMLTRAVQITGISMAGSVPKTFRVFQNYPNPFNPETLIAFQLPGAGLVDVTIYNSLGERVEDLVRNQTYQEGSWNVRFDGARYPSGVYFASVNVSGGTFSGRKIIKMVLIK